MVKVGDRVRYLNAVGGGVVVKIVKDIAYVDEDGFETPVLARECVVVEPAEQAKKSAPVPASKVVEVSPVEKGTFAQPADEEDDLAVEERPEGDRLNITLAYVPDESKHLNTTRFSCYLVNDSNYYLYFAYLSRDDEGWRTRYAGVIEPNIQLLLEEFGQEDVNALERICIQYIAFKKDKHFALKSPVAVEYRLDTTKFYKLHTFRESLYFDEPSWCIDLVKNDVPVRPMLFDASDLERAMKMKKQVDNPVRKPVTRHAEKPGIVEVDLHASALLDTTAGLSNSDILNYQLDKVRETLDQYRHAKGRKIVFIHGKGEGVLRNALLKEIRDKYKNCTCQDASFREYGFGATMVTVH